MPATDTNDANLFNEQGEPIDQDALISVLEKNPSIRLVPGDHTVAALRYQDGSRVPVAEVAKMLGLYEQAIQSEIPVANFQIVDEEQEPPGSGIGGHRGPGSATR